MGGASTAAPVDAAGAGYWNPAGLSWLESSEVYLGAEMLWGDPVLSSSVDLTGRSGAGQPSM